MACARARPRPAPTSLPSLGVAAHRTTWRVPARPPPPAPGSAAAAARCWRSPRRPAPAPAAQAARCRPAPPPPSAPQCAPRPRTTSPPSWPRCSTTGAATDAPHSDIHESSRSNVSQTPYAAARISKRPRNHPRAADRAAGAPCVPRSQGGLPAARLLRGAALAAADGAVIAAAAQRRRRQRRRGAAGGEDRRRPRGATRGWACLPGPPSAPCRARSSSLPLHMWTSRQTACS
jgi:hypothetical protein